VIDSLPHVYLADTTGATEEADDPQVPIACDGRMLAKGKKTVWYQYTTGSTNEVITFDTLASDYDTYIAVWTGTSLTTLSFVACDDDQADLQSELLLNAQANTVYHIEVAGYAGTTIEPKPNSGGNLKFRAKFGAGTDTVGVFRPSNGALYLKNSNTTGYADIAINYGIGGDYPVVGDWDGDGTDTIGVYRNGWFYLRNSNTVGYADVSFPFGAPGDQPIAGDWNGDGIDTIGVYRSSEITFYLRNSNTFGSTITFQLGIPGDVAIKGDWDGDGIDTTGVFRPSNGVIFLKNSNTTGYADIAINYGIGGDIPVTGDWDGNGIDTIGVLRGNTFYLRNSNTVGYADISFDLGIPGDMPIAGNWDGLP
jgi:hypothetical protein